jgi:hypothetical protein
MPAVPVFKQSLSDEEKKRLRALLAALEPFFGTRQTMPRLAGDPR